MATVIRLKRGGRTHAPAYRVVVMDKRDRTRGREVDLIGYYHPCGRPEPVAEVDAHKALDWLKKGAQPSNTVRTILREKGIWAAFKKGTPLPEPAERPQADAAAEPTDTTETAAPTDEVSAGADEASAPADGTPADTDDTD